MTEHRPFRTPGGTGCVQDRSQVAAGHIDHLGLVGGLFQRRGQLAVAGTAQAEHRGHIGITRDPGERLLPGRCADKQSRLRIAQEKADLVRRVCGVQRDVDRAGAQAAEIEQHGFDGFFNLNHDPIAPIDTQVMQQALHTGSALRQLGIAQLAVIICVQKQRRRVLREALAEQRIEIGVTHGQRVLQMSL